MLNNPSGQAQRLAAMGPSGRPTILFIAGFGDDASMFDGLLSTPLAEGYNLAPLNLPGFGAPALNEETSLAALAEFVADAARETDAGIVVAHSVASIIASLAAKDPDCPLTTILSLEGNITAEDAYFSGTAADYDDPHVFRTAFLRRLDEMARSEPIVKRYRDVVSRADPIALWQLGCDARRFSSEHVPGKVLMSSAQVTYFYNPANCPKETLQWLEANPMNRIELKNATHWKSVDQPGLLADKILKVLS